MATGSVCRIVWIQQRALSRESSLRLRCCLLLLLLLQHGQLPLHRILRSAASLHQHTQLRILIGLQLREVSVHLRILLHLRCGGCGGLLLLLLLLHCRCLLHLHHDLLLQLRLQERWIVRCCLCLLLQLHEVRHLLLRVHLLKRMQKLDATLLIQLTQVLLQEMIRVALLLLLLLLLSLLLLLLHRLLLLLHLLHHHLLLQLMLLLLLLLLQIHMTAAAIAVCTRHTARE